MMQKLCTKSNNQLNHPSQPMPMFLLTYGSFGDVLLLGFDQAKNNHEPVQDIFIGLPIFLCYPSS